MSKRLIELQLEELDILLPQLPAAHRMLVDRIREKLASGKLDYAHILQAESWNLDHFVQYLRAAICAGQSWPEHDQFATVPVFVNNAMMGSDLGTNDFPPPPPTPKPAPFDFIRNFTISGLAGSVDDTPSTG